MRRSLASALALALAGPALLALVGCGAGETPPPQRIVLVSLDTVRASSVSGYGDADTTPTLLEIAGEGVLFRNTVAASSYTIPSHMSIFTGLDPAEHGVHEFHARLAPEVDTLASRLKAAGYRTQAFHEGGFVDARFGFGRGFDEYRELPRQAVLDERLPEVLDWIRSTAETPYFLFLHSYSAHFPYGGYERYRREHPERGLPPAEVLARVTPAESAADPALHHDCTLYNQLAERQAAVLSCGERKAGEAFRRSPHFAADLRAIRRSYRERIRRLDAALGRIRAALRERGQWQDTLLVVTSDHGEAFFEHGIYGHPFVPFDEVLRVPLVIAYPRLPAGARGRVEPGLVSHLDLLPTVLSLAGQPVPEGLQGQDLSPVLHGRSSVAPDRTVYAGVLRVAHKPQVPLRRVVVTPALKFIEGHASFGDAEGLLFDWHADPAERENLRTRRPDDFATLAEQAATYRTGLRPVAEDAPAGAAAPLSEDQAERLKALGYADD